MNILGRLCVSYLFWRVVRWLEGVKFLPAQRRTVTITKRLPLVWEDKLPISMNGISAGEYFHAIRRNRCINPPSGDLSDAAFQAWRVKNNR